MYIFEKVTVEQFVVRSIVEDFVGFRAFQRVRQDILSCQFCDTPFQQNSMLHLVFLKNKPNKLICTGCLTRAKLNGAPIVTAEERTKI